MRLALTADGGDSWDLAGAAIPLPTSSVEPASEQVVASTVRRVWALVGSGQVVETVDGGAHWTVESLPGPVVALALADHFVWALACPQTSPGSCHPVLERASGAGGGWTHLPLPRVVSAPDPQIAVASDGELIIQANGAAGKAGALLYSLDLGARWTQEPDPTWSGNRCTSGGLLAAVPNRWWLLCVGGAAAGSSTKGLLRSTDDGRTWATVSAVTTLTQPPPSGTISAAEPSALAATSSDQLWLSLQNGLAGSRDGGTLWADVMGVNSEGFTTRLDVLSSSHVWLLAPGAGLWHTTDGAHWSALGPLNTELAVGQAASRAPAAACRTSQLQLALGPLVSEMTQQNTLVLVLHNISAATCDLRGYPRIALLNKHGSPLPFTYRDRGDQELTGSPPTTVVLAAAARAYLAINKNACVEHATAVVTRISVSPPGQTRPITRTLQGRRPIPDYCPPGDPGHTIDITPIEPTLTAVFATH